ncbi:hypothetical protein M9H77_06656 [Catharanthus roseus]|uniref:Uncharacterized protein n=1 Tax=Catharanthus roseus TaxID=4058 RepID=A0ACC0BSQ5_CATRO|nr:hypothetical protein M9H77_06656 [Catharanthus roseus]
MEEQLQQTEQFRKSHVLPRNILRFFCEQNVGCVVSAQKIYNVVVKIKKNRMKGQNTVEEVLSLSAERGYTYNMPLLEALEMTSTGKNFTVATAFMNGSILNDGEPIVIITERKSGLMAVIDDVFKNAYHMVWTSEVLHFGVETTNRAESEHSVLKLWLSTCHGDLDTVFLSIDSLIEGQITEIKSLLEISKLKEKYGAKSNPILKNISNNISHLSLKKIWLEIKSWRDRDDPQSKYGHYLRKSHGLLCACELVGR